MNLYDTLKSKIIECMKSGDAVERDVLRTLVGEIQSKFVSAGKEPTDEHIEKMLGAFVENAKQCMAVAAEDNREKYVAEIAIYEKYLPIYKTVDEIVVLLNDQVELLKAAKADGPATGMAMGFLKKSGVKIKGADVTEAVKKIRA